MGQRIGLALGLVGDVITGEQEAQSDQQTTCGHERDHVAHAGQQDLPDPGSPADTAGLRTRFGGRRGALHSRCARIARCRNGFGDHLVGLVDRPLDAGGDHRLPGEALPVLDADVGGEDDRVGAGDRVGAHRRAARGTLGLHGQVHAGALGGQLERVGGHVGVGDAGGAGGDRDDRLRFGWLRLSVPGPLRPRVRRRRGLTTPSTSATTSSADFAARSDATKSGRTRARARLDSSFMCSEPAPSGAAIRNTRSAGPSGAPKSTFGDSRANPIDGVDTAADRQCGMAMPPGNPVADCASRASAAALRAFAVGHPSALGEPAGEPVDDRLLVGACVDVEEHQIGTDDGYGVRHGSCFLCQGRGRAGEAGVGVESGETG